MLPLYAHLNNLDIGMILGYITKVQCKWVFAQDRKTSDSVSVSKLQEDPDAILEI